VAEGLYEAKRLAKGQPPPTPYSDLDNRRLITQLEPMTDSLAWKDQARELLRLSSSSYAFDTETGWRDREGYWLGKNVGSNEPVLLFPTQETPHAEELKNILRKSERVAESLEIVVAAKKIVNRNLTQMDSRIRIETEASLLDGLVDFTDYFNEIRRRVTVSTLPDSDLTFQSVYTPSRSENSGDTIEDLVSSWLSESGQRQLALLGGYGQGKSTTALMLTYRLISDLSKTGEYLPRVPLLIELRGTSPRNLTPLQLLGAWASQYNLNPLALMRLHIAGRLLLIFEGFDEMALVGDAEMRLKHFRVLWQFCYPNAKLLITGRPNFFLDHEEMKAALGIGKPMVDRPYCEAVRLASFDFDQIQDALRAHPTTVRDPICKLVKVNPRFAELVSRPSLLHIVSVLWEKETLSEKVDKLNSAYVMDLFVRHSYRRQGLKQSGSPEFMALTSSEREYIMQVTATFMAAQSLPNQISSTQLNEIIERTIGEMPDFVSTEQLTIADENSTPLRIRLKESEHGIDHVKTDARACGLLVDDPASPGMFRFGHKSFMEYLFATVVSQLFNSSGKARARSIMRITGARIDHILSSPVSLDFLAEILTDQVDIDHGITSTTEPLTIQHSIASRIFGTVFDVNRSLIYLQRLALIDLVSRQSLLRRKSPLRFLSPFASVVFLPAYLVMITALWRPLSTTSTPPQDFIFNMNIFALPLVSSMIIALLTQTQTFRLQHKIKIWVRLCKALNIDDGVLHRTIGSWLLPWAKSQSFESMFSVYLYLGELEANEPATSRRAGGLDS
jgi:hypothetical protein